MVLIIFDLDGTLADSIEGLGVSMNMVLESLELPTHAIDKYKDFVGYGFEKLVEQALPLNRIDLKDEATDRMRGFYGDHYKVGLKAYDGIYPLLDSLVGQGYQIGLITNKSQLMADVIMKDYFDGYPWIQIIGHNKSHPAKPDPTTVNAMMALSGSRPDQVFMVGDTEADIRVARNAGINEVFVTWGFRSLDQMAEHQPKQIINHPADLLEILENR